MIKGYERSIVRRTGWKMAVFGVGIAVAMPTVAHASWDSATATVFSSDCHVGSSLAGTGWFTAYGDTYSIRDQCSDGHSVQLEADVAPFGGWDHYDWKMTNSDGAGSIKKERHDIAENTELRVRVCVSEGTTTLSCGGWQQGLS